MGEPLAKDFTCRICEQPYSVPSEPPEGKEGYAIYCTECTRSVLVTRGDSVRVGLREVLGLDGESLALAVETYLGPCPCGARFARDGGKRCPPCIRRIKREQPSDSAEPPAFHCVWDIAKMKEAVEGKFFDYILERLNSEDESLTQLVDRYEAGEIDPGTYIELLEDIRFRDARDIAVIKSWAMLAGPEAAFHAAEEYAFIPRYGSQVLRSIAAGLEMGYGSSVLATLAREEKNLDGPARQEIHTYLKKIGGGF
ncbi:MAG: hypothetical protein PVF51_05435 [Nitrospirota bacterium]|jgi:hypothetical protein